MVGNDFEVASDKGWVTDFKLSLTSRQMVSS